MFTVYIYYKYRKGLGQGVPMGNKTLLERKLRFFWKKMCWLLRVRGSEGLKRFLDCVISLALLILLAPLFLTVALLIKLSDGGPVLYWQTRVGRWGKDLRFPKFRTMVVNADGLKSSLEALNHHGNDITFKIRKDPRITPLGRILRKTSIDELPQLWLVFSGEMSLVGPRPPILEEVKRYGLVHRLRLDILPGLTCIWQVSGRGDLSFQRQMDLDLEYIEMRGFWLDLKILMMTIPAVLTGKGAY